MNPNEDRAQIEALFRNLVRAHAEHDADAIVEAYAEDAIVYSLAPPLGRRGRDREGVAGWLQSWEGPVLLDARDTELEMSGELAFMSGLSRMRGHQAGQDRDIWYRSTVCLRKQEGRWFIVCDHASVPFYMDGSWRAAVDLEP